MNPTEDLLRQTLHHHAQDAPLVQTYQPIKSKGCHLMARWMVPVAVAAVTAAVVGGIAWSDRQESITAAARAQEDPGTGLPDIRGLTGEDVGVALRLQPMQTADQPGCQAFAEYQNGIGFCYEKLTWPDRPASYILGKQITGHAPTDLEADYLAAVLELNAMNDGRIEYDAGREAELTALITALGTQLETRQTRD